MTKNNTGRPRSFDRDEALSTSMNVFWAKGYEGASIKDLTTAMGINSPSLYSAFGDKHRLYLEAIDYYTANEACAPLVAFEVEPDIYEAVRAFFRVVIETSLGGNNSARGCFLSSCVSTSAGEVEGTQERLKQAIADTDARITRRFELEKAKGNLPKNLPSAARAQLMFDLRQGYVFRCRAGLEPESIVSDMEYRVQMILGEESEASAT